jgi:tetraacyldisaccharide 4'-kinase
LAISGDYFRALASGERRGPGPGLIRCGLRLASLPYGTAVYLRNWLYDRGWKRSHRVPVPVVSVGNLTLGGTGKTPCVEYVARFYRQRGRRAAILSRGYASESGPNDEALVLEENLPDVPHYQGVDRVALAAIALEESESEVLVLDDGFQHRRLARDLDLVLIDATSPWGHGLFPRGFLREPASSLRRANLVLLTRCDQVDANQCVRLRQQVNRYAPVVPIVETRHRATELVNSDQARESPDFLSRHPVAAFCGLGNPGAFRRTLTDLGAKVAAFRSFPDHHAYTKADVEDLRDWASQQATDCVVVTTQKDLVKLRLSRLGGRPLWALRICLHIETGQEHLDHQLESVLHRP